MGCDVQWLALCESTGWSASMRILRVAICWCSNFAGLTTGRKAKEARDGEGFAGGNGTLALITDEPSSRGTNTDYPDEEFRRQTMGSTCSLDYQTDGILQIR
jgi:hypothetical protein